MPSNTKRHATARTANGPAAPETTPSPADTANPEQQTKAAAQQTQPPPQDQQPQQQQAQQPPPPPQQPPQQQQQQQQQQQRRGLNITDLKDMSIQKLTQIAKDLNVGGAT